MLIKRNFDRSLPSRSSYIFFQLRTKKKKKKSLKIRPHKRTSETFLPFRCSPSSIPANESIFQLSDVGRERGSKEERRGNVINFSSPSPLPPWKFWNRAERGGSGTSLIILSEGGGASFRKVAKFFHRPSDLSPIIINASDWPRPAPPRYLSVVASMFQRFAKLSAPEGEGRRNNGQSAAPITLYYESCPGIFDLPQLFLLPPLAI